MIDFIDENFFYIAVALLVISWSWTFTYRANVAEKDREIKKLLEDIKEFKQEKKKNEISMMKHYEELKKEKSERIEELKLDKKNLLKFNKVIVDLLSKAKFGQNLTINWQNCTITSSQIDSKAISQEKLDLQNKDLIKELEPSVRTVKTILEKQEVKIDQKIEFENRGISNNRITITGEIRGIPLTDTIWDYSNIIEPDLEKPSICTVQ